MLKNGLSDLAPHQLAAMVTFLVHDLEDASMPGPLPGGYRLEGLAPGELSRYRALFARIGGPWLWFSRLRMPDAELADILGAPGVEVSVLAGEAGDVGLVELDCHEGGAAELAFFGLVPGATGLGLGQALMAHALFRAASLGAGALNVHTCTLDHPKALAFYCKAGFRPVRRAIEIFDDPRLDGTLPRDVALHLPILEN